MTVDELLARITGQELAEWQVLLEKEAEIHRLIRDKVEPEIAVDLVWNSSTRDRDA